MTGFTPASGRSDATFPRTALLGCVLIDLIVHHTWGVTEIKACIMEARNAAKAADPTEQMKRVSHMNLSELRAKANELKIDYANTTTKGNLLRLIRDSLNTPDQELMKIGKFKGYQFCEIPNEELWRVGDPRTDPSRQPRSGARAVREVVQQQAGEPGDKRVPGRPGGATLPELYGCHSRTGVGRCIDDPIGKGILEPRERQGQCNIDYELETQSPSGGRRDQGDGRRDGPQGCGGDPRPRDEVGGFEGQGQDLRRQVSDAEGPDRKEDTEKGRNFVNVLEAPPRGEGRSRGSEVGGRKYCPELPRDCFFSEQEFVEAYRDKHEICVIDFDPGDFVTSETDEEHDLFYDVPDEGEGLEVYECKEFTFEDRVRFAYDSGDFAFSTCQELLEDAFSSVLRGGDGRSRIVDGARTVCSWRHDWRRQSGGQSHCPDSIP